METLIIFLTFIVAAVILAALEHYVSLKDRERENTKRLNKIG